MIVEIACRPPSSEVGQDSATLEIAVPVEHGRFDRVWTDLAIGGDETVGDAPCRPIDDWSERLRGLQRRVGQEQVSEGEVVGGMSDLSGGPVEHGRLTLVGEDVERVEIAVAHHSQSRIGAGCGESLHCSLQRGVVEFAGSREVVVEDTVDADGPVGREGERGCDWFGSSR